jgi:hypothetical protein
MDHKSKYRHLQYNYGSRILVFYKITGLLPIGMHLYMFAFLSRKFGSSFVIHQQLSSASIPFQFYLLKVLLFLIELSV